jgi:hypothetical protein
LASLDFQVDKELLKTRELTLAVTTIRRFRYSLSSTIEAWESFERQGIHTFTLVGLDALRPRWDVYLSSIRGHITELRSYRNFLTEKLELFNGMRDAVSDRDYCSVLQNTNF